MVTAFGIHAELYDFGRFPSPRKLMGYLGITPSEHSSAGKAKRGGITKTGNGLWDRCSSKPRSIIATAPRLA